MLRGTIVPLAIATLPACGSRAPEVGPLHECTYNEADFSYSVGYRVPLVDAGLPAAETHEECLPPGVVSPDDAGRSNCIMLVTLPVPGKSTCATAGFDVPSHEVLGALRARMHDPQARSACVVPQLVGPDLDALGSCSHSSKAGWCSVTGVAGEGCARTIVMTSTTIVPGAAYAFECARGC